MNERNIDLDAPLYEETTELLIPYGPANEKYQDLIRRHKNLGAKRNHDVRRLALALARSIDKAGRCPDVWEMALLEDAGLSRFELPAKPCVGPVKELRLPRGESWED